MKKHNKITKKYISEVCKTCVTGYCCRHGVDVDLDHAKKISGLKLKLKKPWFYNLFKDKDMVTGWAVSTVVRDGRCVFQKKNYLCMIYKNRPIHCKDFPIEEGRIHRYYNYLCEKPKHIKQKIKKHYR